MFVIEQQKAVERGASVVKEPWEESDEDGSVLFAKIKTVGGRGRVFIIKKTKEVYGPTKTQSAL